MSHPSSAARMLHTLGATHRGIYVHWAFVEAFGWPEAVVLTQLLDYWDWKRGEFYKTTEELAADVKMSKRSVERIIAAFRERGFVATRVKQAKGAPTTHYTLDVEAIAEAILAATEEETPPGTESTEPGNGFRQSGGVDSANLAESIYKNYPQEQQELKPLSASPSASADASARKSTSSAKKEAPASSSMTLFPSAPVSTPQPPSTKDVDSQQLDALVATYNEHRTSDKGSLPQTRVRSASLDTLLRRFAADARRSGLDPAAALATVTRHLARNDHYLGKGGGTKYGLVSVLRNWSAHYDAAAEAQAAERPQVKLTPGVVMTLIEGTRKEAVRLLDAEAVDGLVRVERLHRRADGAWEAHHVSRVAVKNLRPGEPGRR